MNSPSPDEGKVSRRRRRSDVKWLETITPSVRETATVPHGKRKATPNPRRAHRRRQDQRRRDQMHANGPVEFFTSAEIGKRDAWLCGICKDTDHPVDPNRKRPDPLSPSVDHIRPVVKGGTHTRDNVRITHWFCNHEKNAHDDELPAYARAKLVRRLYGTPIPEAIALARDVDRRDRYDRRLADPTLDPIQRESLERRRAAIDRRVRRTENNLRGSKKFWRRRRNPRPPA
jgi:hypothetical protein